MAEGKSRRRITLVDVFVVVLIIAILVALFLPAIQAARETGRRTSCLCRTAQIGMAMQNYASTNNSVFPPSSTVSTSGAMTNVNGWSFLVQLLPFMEYDNTYKTLNLKGDPAALLKSKDAATVAASNMSIGTFICPSNGNSSFRDTTTSPPTDALTNYKAMSATTEASLVMCVNPSNKPPYGKASRHPDGAMYPGTGTRLAELQVDGLSHTIIIMETQDDKYSRWIVGGEASLVGLPASFNASLVPGDANHPFYHPSMYDGTFGDSSPVAQKGLRSFLEYDFSPTGADYGKYEDPDWDASIPNTYMYGPSSGHPGVVICGFADASDAPLNKHCDAANMFFLITRENNDPFNIP